MKPRCGRWQRVQRKKDRSRERSFTEASRVQLKRLLCNTLVYLAVWLGFASRHVSGKIRCVRCAWSRAFGCEHVPDSDRHARASGTIEVLTLLGNLLPVTLGNIIGGSVV